MPAERYQTQSRTAAALRIALTLLQAAKGPQFLNLLSNDGIFQWKRDGVRNRPFWPTGMIYWFASPCTARTRPSNHLPSRFATPIASESEDRACGRALL